MSRTKSSSDEQCENEEQFTPSSECQKVSQELEPSGEQKSKDDVGLSSQSSKEQTQKDDHVADTAHQKQTVLNDGIQITIWTFWRRKRYVVTLMTFLGFVNVLALRANVSVAVTDMTTKHLITSDNGTSYEIRYFDWDSRLQGLILSSYFYGYISTQVLGGWLASKFGGNLIFGVGILVTALLTLLTPTFVSLGVYWFVAVRVIEGLFQGVSYPSAHDIWSNWAPPMERSRLATIGTSGSNIGTVISFIISGILADVAGWPSIFYVFGALGLLWYPAWVILVKRGPQYDKHIDPSELKFIRGNMDGIDSEKKKLKHPWRRFFLSMPVWAIIVANFTENWGLYTLLTGLPSFMKDTLEYDIQESGVFSALPSLVIALTMQLAGFVADFVLAKKYLTTTQVRKTFCCSAFVCQGVFMLLTGFVLSPVAAVICLTLSVGLGSFSMAGFFVNHLDLSPRHAGVLMGIGNTAGTLPGIISPTIIGFLVPNKTAAEWRVVFFISSGINFFGAVFYGLFASGEKQSWAEEDSVT